MVKDELREKVRNLLFHNLLSKQIFIEGLPHSKKFSMLQQYM